MKQVKLSDICVKITDGSHNPPKGQPSGKHFMLSSRNIKENGITFDSARLLSNEDFIQENKRTDVMPGDVLLTIVGTIGRTVVVPEGIPKFTLQRSVAVLKPDGSQIDSHFLMFTLRTKLNFLEANARGAAQKGIYLNQLKDIDIALPSLEQQRLTVAKLSSAFDKIDEALKLNERNLGNVSKLKEVAIQHAFDSIDLVPITLNDFCKFENGDRGKNYPSKSKQTESGVPFINAGHLNDSVIDLSGMNFISQDTYEKLGGGKIKPNDILFCLRGSLGKYGSVGDLEQGAIASSLVIVRPDTSTVLPDYLLYYFGSRDAEKMVEKYRNGAAQPNLSASSLKKFNIKIPTVDYQHKIVNMLDQTTSSVRQLNKRYLIKRQYLSELKQSMLNEAFIGSVVK